jgi:hypothetical protein
MTLIAPDATETTASDAALARFLHGLPDVDQVGEVAGRTAELRRPASSRRRPRRRRATG